MGEEYKAPFPHCDSNVLHAPGVCPICDHYPEMQQEREQKKINFTGKYDPDKALCPAEQRRSIHSINKWFGNRPDPFSQHEPDAKQ